MNIGNINNSNSTAFGARFRIVKNKAFKEPSKYFNEWIMDNEDKLAEKVKYVGTDKDYITITLGKNDTRYGTFRKQNMTALAKINGLKIKNNDMDFKYMRFGKDDITRYYENLDTTINEYLDFIKRFAGVSIYKPRNKKV